MTVLPLGIANTEHDITGIDVFRKVGTTLAELDMPFVVDLLSVVGALPGLRSKHEIDDSLSNSVQVWLR